jgi:hypothetical protein
MWKEKRRFVYANILVPLGFPRQRERKKKTSPCKVGVGDRQTDR